MPREITDPRPSEVVEAHEEDLALYNSEPDEVPV